MNSINTIDTTDINTFDAGNINTIDNALKNTVDTIIDNKYGSTEIHPSITDPFTKIKLPSIQMYNTVSKVKEEYRENTSGRQTSVPIIANDKKPTESIMDSTKEIESLKNTDPPTKYIPQQVSEDSKEYGAYTTGRQTGVFTTQDIANDKKPTETNIKTIKAVDFERTENTQSIEWTNDKMDKMTSSTNDNGEYQMITTAHI